MYDPLPIKKVEIVVEQAETEVLNNLVDGLTGLNFDKQTELETIDTKNAIENLENVENVEINANMNQNFLNTFNNTNNVTDYYSDKQFQPATTTIAPIAIPPLDPTSINLLLSKKLLIRSRKLYPEILKSIHDKVRESGNVEKLAIEYYNSCLNGKQTIQEWYQILANNQISLTEQQLLYCVIRFVRSISIFYLCYSSIFS